MVQRVDADLLTWSELVRHAGSAAKARTLIAHELWWRVLHGVYAPIGLADSSALRVRALRRVLPDDVAVSHRAALWVLGVDVLGSVVDITVPRGRHLERRPRLRPHTAALPDEELVDLPGLLVVSAARAVVDVARSEPLVEAVAFGDAALRSGAVDLARIELAMDRAGGLRGIREARKVLPHLEPRSESAMESRFRMRLVLGGLPRPDAQYDVYDDDGHVGRGDLHIDGVVLEYDGRKSHDKRVFKADRRRQNRMCDTGLDVRRFTSDDYFVRPAAAVCAEVVRAIAVAQGRDRSRVRTGPDTLPRPKLKPLPTRSEGRAAKVA